MARNKKLSSGQEEVIRQRLARGDKLKDIAEEFKVSRATVSAIKKASADEIGSLSAEASSQAEKQAILYDYHLTKDKKYQAYTLERVKREVELFEDEEEGWTYHTTAQGQLNRSRSCWWSGIAYPESAPENWKERLEMQGFSIAVSPLHDKDVWNHDNPEKIDRETGEILYKKGELYKVGDKKKAHWHFILISDKPISYKEVQQIVRPITNGPMLQATKSLKNSFEYFLHKNDPTKYQGYDKDEIYKSGNFHIEASKYEKQLIFQEIVNYIVENEIDNRIALVREFGRDPEYMTAMKSGTFINGLIQENWCKHNPEGRTRNIRIVNEFEKVRGNKNGTEEG